MQKCKLFRSLPPWLIGLLTMVFPVYSARECAYKSFFVSTLAAMSVVILTRNAVRTKRVKEARDEAKKEIAEYKANKEDEYKKFEAEVRRQPFIMHEVAVANLKLLHSIAKAISKPRTKRTKKPTSKSSRSPRLENRSRMLLSRNCWPPSLT